jgi:hypothetical protein
LEEIMSKHPACTDKKPGWGTGSTDPGGYEDLGFGFDDEADDEAPHSAFDVGTSPHGLSADLPPADQETPEAASFQFPAKPVLTFDLADDLPEEVSEADALNELQAFSGRRVFDGGRHE